MQIISSLSNSDKPKILDHLKRLDSGDRYLRFFAALNDEALERYVYDAIDLSNSKAFGIFRNDKLVAFAHLSCITSKDGIKSAEVGVTVDKDFRDKKFAKILMDRMLVFCKATGVNRLFMSCLKQNNKMRQIAKSAGLKVVVDHEEALAELNLDSPPSTRVLNISKDLMYEQISIYDACFRRNTELIEFLLKGYSEK